MCSSDLGNLTQHYHTGNQVTGVDVDRNALKLFRERLGLPGHWVDVDTEPLPFADGLTWGALTAPLPCSIRWTVPGAPT